MLVDYLAVLHIHTHRIMFAPPLTAPDRLMAQLRGPGYAVLDAATVRQLAGVAAADLAHIQADWDRLEPDGYLKDGGHYRRRRHASFIVEGGAVRLMPYRPHWQPVDYNALHGGMERWFAPVPDATCAHPAWQALLAWLARVTGELRGAESGRPWFVETHQFRIDTTGGIGRPTPEGAHRDGVDLVAVFIVARAGIKGGETRVFATDGPDGQRFTLAQPWAALLMDDTRVVHETTPIQPVAPLQSDATGHRDTLVVTLRANGFLDPGR